MARVAPVWLKLRGLMPACERADLLLEKMKVPDVPEIANVGYIRDQALARLRSLRYDLPSEDVSTKVLAKVASKAARAEALPPTAGISWDELDNAFAKFLDERMTRGVQWEAAGVSNWEKAEEEAKVTNTTPTTVRKKSISLMTQWSKQYMQGLLDEELFEALNECVSDHRIQREVAERLSKH